MKQVSQRLLVILPLATIGCFAPLTAAKAQQIIPDNTLGSESSIVTPDNIRGIPSDRIDGGAVRDTNLFHSFQQFNIDQGRGAYFNPASNIQNILTRVTGNNPSNILGTLGVLTNANLFLINPNGIIFGQNARLDISGSFVGSTASGILFNNGFEFSATNPEAPPLLTVNIPNGLRFRDNPQPLQVQGNGQGIRTGIDLIDTDFGLRVGETQTLALVGGNLLLEGATLKTAGGRIELGSVAGDGIVSITPISKGFTLGYDGVQNLGNIELSQTAAVDASGLSGGDIQAVGRRVTVSGGSQIEASTIGPGTGGSLFVNARELVELSGGFSGLFAIVYPDITGAGGNLTVNASQLLVRDGAQVSVSTFGAGDGGNLAVKANAIELIGSSSELRVAANRGSTGNAGDLTINTQQLLLRDGAQVVANTFGSGTGGNLTVTATDSVELINGTNPNSQFPTGLFTQQGTQGATGNAGDLTINAPQLIVQDGAQVGANTFGGGEGGNLSVTANSVQLIGRSADGRFPSGLLASAELNSTGNAGDLIINTDELLVQNGAQVLASTFGSGTGGDLTVKANTIELSGSGSGLFAQAEPGATGAAGNLIVETQQLLVRDTAVISASTFGGGEGGNLVVTADSVQLSGRSTDGQFASGLFASATPNSTGNAGDLTINTQQLLVQEGAQVLASTFGSGTGGDLTVKANTIELSGSGSGLFAQAEPGATGAAGNLIVETQQLLVQDGANVSASTFSARNGGNLTVTATNRVELSGRGTRLAAQATSSATGDAGDLTIEAQELVVRDGAQVSAGTFGQGNGRNLTVTANSVQLMGGGSGLFVQADPESTGNAGNLIINTQQLVVQDEADVSASTLGMGNGGNLTINTQQLSVENGADVSTSTSGAGNGGNLMVTADSVQLIGSSSELRVAANRGSTGNAGDLTINTQQLLLRDGAQILASTFGSGTGGNLTVTATDSVELINGTNPNSQFPTGLFAQQGTQGATGNAGNLTINAPQLIVRDGAQISTGTFGGGEGGNLVVKANTVELIGRSTDGQFPSGLFASATPNSTGNAGDLTINTQQLLVQDGANVQASTFGSGTGGDLTLKAKTIELSGSGSGLLTQAEPGATGAAGNLIVETQQLSMQGGAFISAGTFGEGNGGDLTVTATNKVELSGSGSGLFAQQNTAEAIGNAGDLTINTPQLIVQDGADVSTSTSGAGNGGNLNVTANSVQLIGSSSELRVGANRGSTGNAGDLTINTQQLLLRDGAQVSASTFGAGNGGNLNVTATDRVELINGTNPNSQSSTGLFAQQETQGATGNAGNLTINAPQLIVRDGAQVGANTFGGGEGGNLSVTANSVQLIGRSADGRFPSGLLASAQPNSTGNAGDLTINTQQLLVQDGAQVQASTFGSGTGGDLTVKANTIELSGSGSALLAQAEPRATGNAGNLTINTRELRARDEAGVFVRSLGTGTAGNLTVNARSIRLDNEAILTADTRSISTDPNIQQGNITLTARDFVFLNRGSRITANALGNATGGNITITTSNLVGAGNSDITANAVAGRGGQITIRTEGLFGFVVRNRSDLQRLLPSGNFDLRLLPTSDISAISQEQADLSSRVSIDTSNVDPSQDLVDLPDNVIDPSQQIAQNPCQQGTGSEFLITGRGGFPSNPNQTLSSNNIRVDLVEPVPSTSNSVSKTKPLPSNNATAKRIVPAQGWVFNDKGQVVLTAYDPTSSGTQRSWQSASCAAPQSVLRK